MADTQATNQKEQPLQVKQSPISDGDEPVSVSEFEKETGTSLNEQKPSSPLAEKPPIEEEKPATPEPKAPEKKEEKKEKKQETKLSDKYTEDPFKEKKEFNFSSVLLVILFFIIIALVAFIAYGFLKLSGSEFSLSDIF